MVYETELVAFEVLISGPERVIVLHGLPVSVQHWLPITVQQGLPCEMMLFSNWLISLKSSPWLRESTTKNTLVQEIIKASKF